MSRLRHTAAARSGATLIEVAMGVVVLAALAVGAAALYHQSWGQISIQRNKRAALVAANARLEALRASNYDDITPPVEDYGTYYISGSAGAWGVTASAPDETVKINRQDQPITTTVTYRDADPGNMAVTYDYVAVQVAVGYRLATPEDRVVLDTLISP